MIGTKRYPFPDTFPDALALPDHQFKSLFGRQCVKGWHDLQQIEAFLRTHRIARIVELGTGAGMHTLYLGVWAALNGAEVWTVDLSDEAKTSGAAPLAKTAGLPIVWINADVLTVAPDLIAGAYNAPGRVLLYADMGIGELSHWVPLLRPDDFIVVHNWASPTSDAELEVLQESGVLVPYETVTWERSGDHRGFIRA